MSYELQFNFTLTQNYLAQYCYDRKYPYNLGPINKFLNTGALITILKYFMFDLGSYLMYMLYELQTFFIHLSTPLSLLSHF